MSVPHMPHLPPAATPSPVDVSPTLTLVRMWPDATVAFESFNPQADGLSALALACTHASSRTSVFFDGLELETTYGGPEFLTALVPGALYATPGSYTVQLRDGERRSNVLLFEVRPGPPTEATSDVEATRPDEGQSTETRPAVSRDAVGRRCFVLIASGNDDTYLLRGTLTAIRSIRRSNPSVPVVVLHHDLSTEQQRLFADTILTRITLRDFDFSDRSTLMRPDIPRTTFLTLHVDQIEQFDVAIYVDADAVVLDSLTDVFDVDAPLAARIVEGFPLVEHFDNGEQVLEREGIRAPHPINNGLVRFDLNYWRGRGLLDEASGLYHHHGQQAFRYSDQSLLNLIAYKTPGFFGLSRTYNFCRYPDMLRMEHGFTTNALGLVAPKVHEGVVKVVHWTGPLKPWNATDGLDNARTAMCLDCYQQFQS
jgi:lipopolysaccharide biosynthesis glycosyltransferase